MSASEAHAPDFQNLIATIERSPIAVAALAVDALTRVRDGIITGEGPTTRGRVHFSRCLDAVDTKWCSRILIAAGGADGAPVSREEAEALMLIDAAATDRADEGRFDDLFVKAITHHVMAASGRPVPPRPIALASDTPLDSWAEAPRVAAEDREVLDWIVGHVRSARRSSRALMALAVLLIGAAAPLANSIGSVVDFTG